MTILAILQNMWDPARTEAPNVFRINPRNHTGKKLYFICGQHELWVTNSSSKCAPCAKVRLPPDLLFLRRAILRRDWDCYLVCGNQARDSVHRLLAKDMEVLKQMKIKPVVFMPHPAARMITNRLLHSLQHHLIRPDPAWLEWRQHKGDYSINEVQQ